MASFSGLVITLNPSASSNFLQNPAPLFFSISHSAPNLFTRTRISINTLTNGGIQRNPNFLQRTNFSAPAFESGTESEYETEEEYNSSEEYTDGEEGPATMAGNGQTPPPVKKRRRRYRKQYPGEKEGISEELRFVAMKLRNNGKNKGKSKSADNGVSEEEEAKNKGLKGDKSEEENGETWQPSMEGFLKYLVDSKMVFTTIERIVDESTDVSYVYFRKTGLERSDGISRDIEWLREQGNEIPLPSSNGIEYSQYLEELSETSPPLFLSHFYNIYFSHIAGGQVIVKQVSEKLLKSKELEFYKWEGDAQELLKGVRDKLNALGEHWTRDEKNKCLREATKAFRFMGQIVRLIIL